MFGERITAAKTFSSQPLARLVRRTESRPPHDLLALESQIMCRGMRRGGARKLAGMERGELERLVVTLEEEMFAAAEELRFEYAAKLRDEIRDLRRELDEAATAAEG